MTDMYKLFSTTAIGGCIALAMMCLVAGIILIINTRSRQKNTPSSTMKTALFNTVLGYKIIIAKKLMSRTYFCTDENGAPFTRIVYHLIDDNRVVALVDKVKNQPDILWVETQFYTVNEKNMMLYAIQEDSGVYGVRHMKLFDMKEM